MEIKELERLSAENREHIARFDSDKAGLISKLGEECSSLPKKDIKDSALKEIVQAIDQLNKDIKAINKTLDEIQKKKSEITTIDNELKEIRDDITELNSIFGEKQAHIGSALYDLIHNNPEYSTYKDLYADFENTKKEIAELKEKKALMEEQEKGIFGKVKAKVNVWMIQSNIKSKEKELNNLYPVIGSNLIQSDFFEKLKETEHQELKKLILETKTKLEKQQRDEKDNIMLKEKKADELAEMTGNAQPDAFIKEKETEIKNLEKELGEKYSEAGMHIHKNKLSEMLQKKEQKDIYNSITEIDKNIEQKAKNIEMISFAMEFINKSKVLAELKNKEERINSIIEQNRQELETLKGQIAETEKQVEITRKNAGNFIEM